MHSLVSWLLWCMPKISACGGLRQGHHKFKGSQDYNQQRVSETEQTTITMASSVVFCWIGILMGFIF